MKLLVVGRGLLGGAVARRAGEAVAATRYVPWDDPSRAVHVLTREVEDFLSAADEPWSVAWCAGSGFVGSDAEHFRIEREYLAVVLGTLQSTSSATRGSAFFLASSAGGVNGLGSRGVATESTPPSPRSEYGQSKLAQEEMVRAWSAATGVPSLIGRISNLYGPAQNIEKSQGFISHLCRSMLLHRPFVLSVSGETQRDFLHADDAAARIVEWLSAPSGPGGAQLKVLAAGRSVSLLQLIDTVRAASGVRPRVVMAANEATALQPRYLRFASTELTQLDARHPARPLPEGVHQMWMSMLRSYVGGLLAG